MNVNFKFGRNITQIATNEKKQGLRLGGFKGFRSKRKKKADDAIDDLSESTRGSTIQTTSSEPVSSTEAELTTTAPPPNKVTFRTVSQELTEQEINDNDALPYNYRTLVTSSIQGPPQDATMMMPSTNTQNLGQTRTWQYRSSTLLSTKVKIIKSMKEDYTEILLNQSKLGRHGVVVHLRAADHLIEQFLSLQDVIEQAYLPKTLQDMLYEHLEAYIRPRIATHCDDDTKLSPEEAAKLVIWINSSLLEKLQSCCPNITPTLEWRQDEFRMLSHYLNTGVRHEMGIWVARSVETWLDLDLRFDANSKNEKAANTLITSHPEDVIFLIDSQLSVARDRLPSKYTDLVWAACIKELSTMVQKMLLQLEMSWENLNSARFCSIINDANRLAEKVEGYNDEYLCLEADEEQGDILVCELSQLALEATKLLCERILQDLREPEPILTAIGTPSWEADEAGDSVGRTIATFKDYFDDVDQWIESKYYFPKVLKHCFDLTLKTYVESFFSNTMKAGIQNASDVSARLSQDYISLVVFFNGRIFEDYHGVAGFYDQPEVNYLLHIIQSLSNMINPDICPDELLSDTATILEQFGSTEKGSPAVLHLVGLRKRHSRAESLEWLKVIASAKNQAFTKVDTNATNNICLDASHENAPDLSETAKRQRSNGRAFYCLPDLRNSKFVFHLRHQRNQEMLRRISFRSQAAAISANKLLQKSPNRFLSMVTAHL